MKINIEVGSNSGKDTDTLINPEFLTFAFEPSIFLYCELVQKFKDNPNVILVPFAVSDVDGLADFNASSLGDKGLGSLYDYNEKLLESPLKKHPIFHQKFDRKQKVLSVRLDSFLRTFLCNYRNPEPVSIEYLWIDAQGSDFKVIQSLGDFLPFVKEGRCECTYKIPLYSIETNTYENVKNYLEENGFNTEILKIHDDESELDLRFWKK